MQKPIEVERKVTSDCYQSLVGFGMRESVRDYSMRQD